MYATIAERINNYTDNNDDITFINSRCNEITTNSDTEIDILNSPYAHKSTF